MATYEHLPTAIHDMDVGRCREKET